MLPPFNPIEALKCVVMKTLSRPIDDVSANDDLRAFVSFTKGESTDVELITVDDLDFMQVARLMSQVFVIDIKLEPKHRLLFRYTGSKLDEEYGMNLMGKFFEDVYEGDTPELIIGNLYDAVDQRKTAYLRQHLLMDKATAKYRMVERIAIPASSNGEALDRLVGMITFNLVRENGPECVTLL